MADVITLDLELIDKVGGPAKRAADALRRVEEQQKRTQAALKREQDRTAQTQEKIAQGWAKIGQTIDKAKAKEAAAVAKASAAAEKAAAKQIAMTERVAMRSSVAQMRATQRAMREDERAAKQKERDVRRMGLLQQQAQKMNEKFDKEKKGHGGFLASFRHALPFRSVGDYAKGAFWGHLAAEGVEKVVEGFVEGAHKAVELVYEGIKEAFKAGAGYEQLKLNYRLLLGKEGGKEALEDIERFSGKTRYDDDEVAMMMRPLFNAGFRGTGARSAFAAATDLNAAGLGETQDFVDQITKIKLKGGVQAKQLVGMGVDVKTFSKSLAAALHTDAKTAMENAKEGKADPQLLLNLIYEGIEKRQGGKLGTGSEAMAATFGARMHKLSMLPEDFLKHVSDSPEWNKVSDKIGAILHELDPTGPKGKRIVDALIKTFDRLAGYIQRVITPENIEKFTDGVEKAFEYATKLPEIFKEIVDDAKLVALVWAGMKLAGGKGGGGGGAAPIAAATKGAELVANALGVGAGVVGIAASTALLAQPDKQAESMDEENDRLVKQGKRRAVDHWWGTTYEDVEPGKGGGAPSVKVGDVHVTVNASGADPSKEVGEKVGAEIQRNAQRAMEQATQERGGR